MSSMSQNLLTERRWTVWISREGMRRRVRMEVGVEMSHLGQQMVVVLCGRRLQAR